MRKNLHFEPSARLQSILSRELVADPNVAVLEFVKNGYDAGATQVLVEFQLGDEPRTGTLTVADDGEGMDLDDFQKNWMRPGYSQKADAEFVAERARVPAGEKGLGRLAAGRLGEVLDVYTRKQPSDPWLHARFVWSDFEDMDQTLADVDIPVDDESEPDITLAEVGTIVQISGLRLNWDAKVPGRKAAGRHPTRIGRLRQDLEMLLLPLSVAADNFEIWLNHDSSQPDDEPSGRVDAPFVDLTHYKFQFEVMPRGNGWQVKRTISRGTELLHLPLGEGLQATEVRRVRIPPPEDGAPVKDVGRFSGTFLYAPDRAEQLRRLRAPVGVPLYRDGIRVEPYGRPGNDWLGAQARKASRQGYAAIQPAALYGAVVITRDGNPNLRSQANREGLIENDAFETFSEICREEFSAFEKIVFDEYVEPNWRPLDQQRRERAEGRQGYALTLTRSLMHAVNQPVATANAHLDHLHTVIERQVSDTHVRAELQALHDKTALQLGRIGDAITRVLEVVDFDPTPERFAVHDLVDELVRRRAGVGADDGIRLEVDVPERFVVDLPPIPVRVAIEELLDNAGQASRASGVEPWVRISAIDDRPSGGDRKKNGKEQTGHQIAIQVEDNGTGIDLAVREGLFHRAASTKGGIGMGLILIRQLMHLIGANIELDSKVRSGTQFVITLPKAEP